MKSFRKQKLFQALIIEWNFLQEWNLFKLRAYFSIEWELLSDSPIPVDVEKLINSIVCDNALYNQGLKLESTALAPILADLYSAHLIYLNYLIEYSSSDVHILKSNADRQNESCDSNAEKKCL
jgi:hypothetical protein